MHGNYPQDRKGNTVTARTIEWAASDMNSLYVVVPRGYTSQPMTPDGATGMRFKTKYGYVGLAVEQSDFVTEGLNEKACQQVCSISRNMANMSLTARKTLPEAWPTCSSSHTSLGHVPQWMK